MAEMTPWAHLAESTGHTGMLCWQDIVYTEVCDPATRQRVPFGSEGSPVYTHLERNSQPMIRLLSGDLTRWEAAPSPCGRTYPSCPMGSTAGSTISSPSAARNIYPSAINDIVSTLAGYGGEHRIIVSREDTMDRLVVQVEHVSNLDGDGVSSFRQLAKDRLRATLGVSTEGGGCPAQYLRALRHQDPPGDRRAGAVQRDRGSAVTGARRDLSAELTKARDGDVVALSQLVSAVESRRRDPRQSAARYLHHGRPRQGHRHHRPAGQRESSLTSALLRELRQRGERVAVVAVDPSSALTGGAILGDRLRMTEHSADAGVYVRSVSARGALGGLSRATADIVAVLDSVGWDTVIVETVGVGQDEVDIMRIAHTVVVVSVPGLGDDVQAMKAGLLEGGGPARGQQSRSQGCPPHNGRAARHAAAGGSAPARSVAPERAGGPSR